MKEAAFLSHLNNIPKENEDLLKLFISSCNTYSKQNESYNVQKNIYNSLFIIRLEYFIYFFKNIRIEFMLVLYNK